MRYIHCQTSFLSIAQYINLFRLVHIEGFSNPSAGLDAPEIIRKLEISYPLYISFAAITSSINLFCGMRRLSNQTVVLS